MDLWSESVDSNVNLNKPNLVPVPISQFFGFPFLLQWLRRVRGYWGRGSSVPGFPRFFFHAISCTKEKWLIFQEIFLYKKKNPTYLPKFCQVGRERANKNNFKCGPSREPNYILSTCIAHSVLRFKSVFFSLFFFKWAHFYHPKRSGPNDKSTTNTELMATLPNHWEKAISYIIRCMISEAHYVKSCRNSFVIARN